MSPAGAGRADNGGSRAGNRLVKRVARAVLTRAAGNSVWGQAIVAELDEVRGTWAIVRWTAGGLRVGWQQSASPARRAVLATAGAAAVMVLASQFVVGVRYMASGAMQPTVRVDSRLVIDRIGFKLTGPRHGELFALRLSGVDGKRITTVSRLIGLPGDRIECRDGAVHRNGAALSEPYLLAGTKTDCEPHVVASETVYVLGDHRVTAVDSRSRGDISIDDLVGRVVVIL